MTAAPDTIEADRALKAKHAAMWALGDYPSLASDLIADLGEVVVRACAVGPSDRVLDVAAGCGNAAIPAAQAGAAVVACDLTPELLAAGERQAGQLGVQLQWRQGDAEALPFADGEFDVVMSCLGVMFAPHHQASASELIRVCRPGGTIGLLSWTSEGFIGQMFAAMKPYAAPSPPGVQPPPLWGNEEHVRGLLGSAVHGMTAVRDTLGVSLFARPEHFRDYFKARYGPVVAAYQRISDDPEKVAALDEELAELARRHDNGGASTAMDWEYLLITARRQR
jgi:SAM-dependent methyltransferase